MTQKYWCCLTKIRRQVTLKNCQRCDILAGVPVGTYEYCLSFEPYRMQICEAFHDLIWWLKLLWKEPIDFIYFLVSALFRTLRLQWGYSISFCHGKIKRKLLIGLRKV